MINLNINRLNDFCSFNKLYKKPIRDGVAYCSIIHSIRFPNYCSRFKLNNLKNSSCFSFTKTFYSIFPKFINFNFKNSFPYYLCTKSFSSILVLILLTFAKEHSVKSLLYTSINLLKKISLISRKESAKMSVTPWKKLYLRHKELLVLLDQPRR